MVLTSDTDLIRRLFTEYADIARGGSSAALSRSSGRGRSCCSTGPSTCASAGSSCRRLHGETMRAQAPLVAELAEREIASWPRDEPVATLPRMRALTLEVVLRLVFGARDRAEVEPLRAAIERPLRITSSLPRLIGLARGMRRPWQMFDRAVAALDAEVATVIARRRADPHEGSVLDLLLAARDEDGEPLTDAELRDQLVTLLAAGHETTASGLAWAFERLSRHPEVLHRIRAGDDAYLDATVREVLRIRPVLVLTPRRLNAPLTFGGHDLPAGTFVSACSYLVHRRPDLYPEPLAFRPERWLGGASCRRTRSSRSAGEGDAAPARRSRRWRWPRCCASPPATTCFPSTPGPSARAAAPWPWRPPAAGRSASPRDDAALRPQRVGGARRRRARRDRGRVHRCGRAGARRPRRRRPPPLRVHAGRRPGALAPALAAGTEEALRRIDLSAERGIHPHVGVVDVVPFVHRTAADRGAACAEALVAGEEIGRLGVPVLLYGSLAAGRTRAEIRRGGPAALAERLASGELAPDFGPPRMDPRRGATLVAARPPLIAFNLEVDAPLDVALAAARAVREGGADGLPGVRALGLELETGGIVQVSVNVEDHEAVPLAMLLEAVRRHAPVVAGEVVGLPPRAAFDGWPDDVPVHNRRTLEEALGE